MTNKNNSKKFDPYDFSKKTIDGVDIYHKNLPWSPCIHINVVFTTGAFNDPEGKEGLSHFLEHMIFDGSPTLPDKKAIKEWSKMNALNTWNAWTSFYQTNYHLRCLPERYEDVIKGMKDMIFSPLLRNEDVEHERKVITQEAWGRFQNQKYLTYIKEVTKNIYHDHPHENISSPLGWPETVSIITKEDIEKWHKENYVKGNFHIVIVGNIKDKNIKILEKFIKDLPTKKFKKQKKASVLKPKENRWVKNADDIGEIKEQVEITISRSMDSMPQNLRWIDSAFRRVAYDLLIEKLRFEKSLCYSVKVATYPYWDHTEVFVNLKTEEKNISIVEKEFWNTLDEIKKGIHKNRFELIKNLGLDQIRSDETTSDDVENVGVSHVHRYDGKITTKEQILRDMKKVTYKDVTNYVEKVFDKKYVFTEIILPSKK
jgi:predicted Zn-dependent peptidase